MVSANLKKYLPSFGGGIAFLSILALVAVTRPLVEQRLDDAGYDRARTDCNKIAQALDDYATDTGFQPCGYEGLQIYTWLRGPGAEPRFETLPRGTSGRLEWFINQPKMSGSGRWQGAYLPQLAPDPWGRSYLIFPQGEFGHAGDQKRQGHSWVLSAGPNGIVETLPGGIIEMGDDVALLVD
ncbi:MAG: hypothetical protein V3W41_20225 [Planctomycetota bacterium]